MVNIVAHIGVKLLETFKVLVLSKSLLGVQLQYVSENANISIRVFGSQPHPKVELSLDLSTSYLSASGMHCLMHAHNAF
jgi:hypothetical protein